MEYGMEASTPVQESNTASFWRRIGALVIDGVFLAGIGFGLGLLFESWFVSLGDAARLVGFSIALIYFGVMNSELGKGQTLGKQALNLKVVDSRGEFISPLRSFARYTIFAIPFYLNNLSLSPETLSNSVVLPYLLSFIIFGGIFSTTYLYIFNKRTRQTLHDLIVDTYVIQSEGVFNSSASIWKPHLAIVALISLVSVVAVSVMSEKVNEEPFSAMLATQSEILKVSPIRTASVTHNQRFVTSSSEGSKSFEFVNVRAVLTENEIADKELSKTLSDIVFSYYPNSREVNAVNVTLSYGYDIGIWSSWSHETHSYNFTDSMSQ
ncbi:RDD family protein [Litoribrevibacter euphylliae]|uniref:RDD family protein n=1 Tax=Litoribrevibacter euphylliae TaxID=1834034 RepID=A0ABV7HGP8_9GAMM